MAYFFPFILILESIISVTMGAFSFAQFGVFFFQYGLLSFHSGYGFKFCSEKCDTSIELDLCSRFS